MDQHKAFIHAQRQLRKLQKENAELRHLNAYLTAEGNVLRKEYPDRWQNCQGFFRLLDRLQRALATARSERDEARRSYCRAFVDIFPSRYEEMMMEDAAELVAKDLGWKCFHYETHADAASDEGFVTSGKEAKDGHAQAD